MTDVPAMCAGCGTPLAFDALRILRITPEGRVDLQHERDDGRCGPVIVAALAAAAPEDSGRFLSPAARRLEITIRTYLDTLKLLPQSTGPINFAALVDAYELHLIRWAFLCEGSEGKGAIQRVARRLRMDVTPLYKRLSRWRAAGIEVWRLRRWSPEECDAAVFAVVATGRGATADEIAAAIDAPAHYRGTSKIQTIHRALVRLTAAGALTRTRPSGFGQSYRYAIAQRERGAA